LDSVDEEPTVSERAGRTAIFPSRPPQPGPPQPGPPEREQQTPVEALLPPVGAGHHEGAPPGKRDISDGSARRLLIPAVIAAGILLVAIGIGLAWGNLFGGNDKNEKKNQPPAGFSTVSESKGHLSVTVPTAWAKQQEESWQPSSVGLARDTQPEPVLRATPNLVQFRALKAATPGVFVGMTRDLTPGRLPPPSVSQHPGCTQQQPTQYQRGTLKGTITRWVRCDGGPISFSEIGLTDSSGKIGLWIRVKQIDNNDLTSRILDSLQVKAP
jgi:hypothetical protein